MNIDERLKRLNEKFPVTDKATLEKQTPLMQFMIEALSIANELYAELNRPRELTITGIPTEPTNRAYLAEAMREAAKSEWRPRVERRDPNRYGPDYGGQWPERRKSPDKRAQYDAMDVFCSHCRKKMPIENHQCSGVRLNEMRTDQRQRDEGLPCGYDQREETKLHDAQRIADMS